MEEGGYMSVEDDEQRGNNYKAEARESDLRLLVSDFVGVLVGSGKVGGRKWSIR